jgi:hypothetical protein
MHSMFSRREMLTRSGTGFGMLGLSSVLANEVGAGSSPDPMVPKKTHFPAKAKNIIFLFMNGGPSHVDTFDPKPELKKQEGKPGKGGNYMPSPYSFKQYGESGIPMSEIYPHLSECADELCILNGMHTSTPNHEPGLLMMNSGAQQPVSWEACGWSGFVGQQFSAGDFPGHAHQQLENRSEERHRAYSESKSVVDFATTTARPPAADQPEAS